MLVLVSRDQDMPARGSALDLVGAALRAWSELSLEFSELPFSGFSGQGFFWMDRRPRVASVLMTSDSCAISGWMVQSLGQRGELRARELSC